METFIPNLLLKTSRFYLLNLCVAAFPANRYSCLKPAKHDVALMSFMGEVSELASFSFVRFCQIDGLGVQKIWR